MGMSARRDPGITPPMQLITYAYRWYLSLMVALYYYCLSHVNISFYLGILESQRKRMACIVLVLIFVL